MGDLQVVNEIKKLNNQNYNTWSMYMESYLQDQDLWEIVSGKDIPLEEDDTASKKWKVKAARQCTPSKPQSRKTMKAAMQGNVPLERQRLPRTRGTL
ncbi:hypothetical protein DITRI_Ditri06bG0016000 [Diplodiscus trichospermus]